jgi:hypothetical protein
MAAGRGTSAGLTACKDECVSNNMTLMNVDGVWTIFYQGTRYMDLLDARSRDDALAQIVEMIFMESGMTE